MDKQSKGSLLVVDDDKNMIESLKDCIELSGYTVTLASDGYKAIEMVRNNVVDVILMDIKMPDMDGVETLEKINRISPRTNVLMMTGYEMDDLAKEAIYVGALDVLYKPLDFKILVDLLDKIMKKPIQS